MTQKIWEDMVKYATSLGYQHPEDAVQDCLEEDLRLHGQVTSYTRWLIARRRPNEHEDTQRHTRLTYERHGDILLEQYPLDEAMTETTELDTTRITLRQLAEQMATHEDLYTAQELSVFVLRIEGYTTSEVGRLLHVTRQRAEYILKRVHEKLRKYVGEEHDA